MNILNNEKGLIKKIKLKSSFNIDITISIIFTFYILNSMIFFHYNFLIYTGFTTALEDTKDIIDGFVGLISALKLLIAPISHIFGFKTILLFLCVLFISAGLSFIGVPKGKPSFLSSLFFANIIWFSWSKSFDSEEFNLFGQIFLMLKTNLVLLLPIIFIYLIKKIPIISQKFIPGFFSFIKNPFINKNKLEKEYIIKISEKFQEYSSLFQKSLFRDILQNNNEKKIILSGNTYKFKKELELILKEFDTNSHHTQNKRL